MSKKVVALLLSAALAVFVFTMLRYLPFPPSHGKTGPVSSFGLIHRETTGITNSVKIKDKEIFIRYAVGSNQAVLDDLERRLKPELYLANANGQNVVIHGYLHPEVKWTPNRPDMATPEPYQEFTLTGWEMKTPFFADAYEEKPSRFELRRSDFE